MLIIRDMEQRDETVILEMMKDFYNSPACLHIVPEENFRPVGGRSGKPLRQSPDPGGEGRGGSQGRAGRPGLRSFHRLMEQ